MLELITANIRRRMMRTSITAAGIAFGVAAVVALLALSAGLNQTAAQLVHLGRADLGLFQREAADPTSSVLPLSLLGRVKAQPEVSEATPIQLVVSDVPHAPGAIVFGVDPNGFVARLLVLTAGRAISPGRVDVGDQLAHQLHLEVGATLRLGGRTFAVAGVFHSSITEEDAGVIHGAERRSGARRAHGRRSNHVCGTSLEHLGRRRRGPPKSCRRHFQLCWRSPSRARRFGPAPTIS